MAMACGTGGSLPLAPDAPTRHAFRSCSSVTHSRLPRAPTKDPERLQGGTFTTVNAPSIDWTTPVNARRLELFRTLLAAFQPGRLVDLGSGHGRFAQEAVIRGWDATAVDARTERRATDSTVTWIKP